MTDQIDRLRESLDEVAVPDRWELIVARSAEPDRVWVEPTRTASAHRSRERWLATAAALVLVVGGAVLVGRRDPDGSTTLPDVPGTATGTAPLACDTATDLAAIVSLTRARPGDADATDPPTELPALMARNPDAVLIGSVTAIDRRGGTTRLELAVPTYLHGGGPVTAITLGAEAPDTAVATSAGARVEVAGLLAVAFVRTTDAGTTWVPEPHGLFLGCAGTDVPAVGTPDPVPTFLTGSIDDIAGYLQRALGDSTTPTTPAPVEPTWVPRPIELPPPLDVDDVPRLVLDRPGLPPPRVVRFEPVTDATAGYLQVFATADGNGWLHVETGSTTDRVDAPGAAPIDPIGPWSVSASEQDGISRLDLVADPVQVTLSTNALTVAQLREVASGMRQGEPHGGWVIAGVPGGLEPVAEGADRSTEVRLVTYSDEAGAGGALQVNADAPSLLSTELAQPGTEVVDLDGARAVFLPTPLPTLVWQYAPRVVVRLGLTDATVDQLLDAARSVRLVDAAEWDQIDSYVNDDGCPSLWC